MSAYVVSDELITAIINGGKRPLCHGERPAYYYGSEAKPLAEVKAVGQILLNENYKSVNHRYGENESGTFHYEQCLRSFSPVAVLKMVNRYTYQACEAPDWPQSEAYAIVETIKERMIVQLPGYEEADVLY